MKKKKKKIGTPKLSFGVEDEEGEETGESKRSTRQGIPIEGKKKMVNSNVWGCAEGADEECVIARGVNKGEFAERVFGVVGSG